MKDLNLLLRAGYRSDPNETEAETDRVTSWGVSGGIGHSSGFTVSGSYGTSSEKGSDVRPFKWNAEVGWAGKVNDMGKTNVAVGYGVYNDGKYGEAKYYYFAVNQAIDAAAADVYFGVSNDTGTVTMTTPAVMARAARIVAVEPATGSLPSREVETRYTISTADDVAVSPGLTGDQAAVLMPEDEATLTPAGNHAQVGDGETPILNGPVGEADAAPLASFDPANAGFRAGTTLKYYAGQEAQASRSEAKDRDGVLVFIAGVRVKF